MLKQSVNPDLSGKKKVDSKKSSLVVIAIIFLLSALSVWCVIPKDTMNSSLVVRTYDVNVECLAQGDYNPKPLGNTEVAPQIPAHDENEMYILCAGAQGDYKPKPLDPDDTTNTKITPLSPKPYYNETIVLCSGQGDIKPKPLVPDDTTNTKITPEIPGSYETEMNILCSGQGDYTPKPLVPWGG